MEIHKFCLIKTICNEETQIVYSNKILFLTEKKKFMPITKDNIASDKLYILNHNNQPEGIQILQFGGNIEFCVTGLNQYKY